VVLLRSPRGGLRLRRSRLVEATSLHVTSSELAAWRVNCVPASVVVELVVVWKFGTQLWQPYIVAAWVDGGR
jgi:hypothetical protein